MEGEAETSKFESSETVAEFLGSTSLFSDSWKLCSATYANSMVPGSGSFVTEEVGGVGYVSFSSVQSFAELNLNENNLVPLDSGVLSCLQGEDEGPPMVHAGFLRLFLSVYNGGDFQHKILALMEKCKSIIFTGHSIGGAVASLAALCLMSQPCRLPVMCITYGSPLIGNGSLAKAIAREKWEGNFINLVSKHDVVPRLLFVPLTSDTAQVDGLFQLLSMTSPQFRPLASQSSNSEELHTFHRGIVDYLTTAARDESMQSPYKPIGSYLLCSKDGAICLDDIKAVVKMLHLTFMDSSLSSTIDDHLGYGEIVMRVSQKFSRRGSTQVGDLSDTYHGMGTSSALRAAGLGSPLHLASLQDPVTHEARECLRGARKKGCPNRNSASLVIRLAKISPHRAQIEWYKTRCDNDDEHMGYYDSFKRKRAFKREQKVNMFRIKLGDFWDDVIEMVESNQLPHDFQKFRKWVNASQSYKLLVEPLAIADYYRSGVHRVKGHYLKHGRERRFEIFDKWWRERDLEIEENFHRTNFAGLTQDSCFWAKVEEATEWLTNVRTQNDPQKLAELWQNIEQFEQYARKLVDSKEVSRDVVARNSSYIMWVGELEELKRQYRQMPPRFSGYLGSGGGIIP